ncbi:Autophagy protein 22 [Linderina pennispora]|nr:Autophagy protein 22 [Linderina pennispora]
MSTAPSLLAAMEGYKLDHITPCDYNAADYTRDYRWAGRWVDTTSFSLYMATIANLIQAILYIALGTLADLLSNRKRMLLGFAGLGSASCICLLRTTKPSVIDTATPLHLTKTRLLRPQKVEHDAHHLAPIVEEFVIYKISALSNL